MVFNVFKITKHHNKNPQCFKIDIVEEIVEETSKGKSSLTPLYKFIVNSIDNIEEDQDQKLVECVRKMYAFLVEKTSKKIEELEGTEKKSVRQDELNKINSPELNKLPSQVIMKDHFPLLFMNQMLEMLVGQTCFYFVDGYFLTDQEKNAFTCPFIVFSHWRMHSSLCNASTTFRRCVLSIFVYMIKSSIKVFMDFFVLFSVIYLISSLITLMSFLRDASK